MSAGMEQPGPASSSSPRGRRVVPFYVLPVLMLMASGVAAVFVLDAVAAQRFDADVIDVAGRQRMLNQRLLNEVLMAPGATSPAQEGTRALFVDSLRALRDGGRAIMNEATGEAKTLPPAPTEEIRDALTHQWWLMDQQIEASRTYLGARKSAKRGALLQTLKTLNRALHVEIDATVKLFHQHSVANVDRALGWAAAAAVLLALLCGAVFWGSRRITRLHRRSEREAALRLRAMGHLDAVVTGVLDGIISISERGEILTVNPAAEAIFGYRAAEMVGKNVRMLMPEPYRGEHDGYLQRYLETGDARIIGLGREVEGLRKDGTVFPMALAVSEIQAGSERQFVGVQRDISELKAAERALRAAKEAAEGASRAKGQFLANMSHELRTPLNAIIGYGQLVEEELERLGHEQLTEDVRRVHVAGRHLLGLINDVLDLSKIEAGVYELSAETFELAPIIAEVAETIHPLAEERGNTLTAEIPDDAGSMFSDPTKLRQILYNLLSNACKFTHDGAITLAVRRTTRAGEPWLDITVRDTGIGMSPEALERVWDAFAQADASTTRTYGGTGLGLTITRRLCELMGGRIDVTSEPGAGTTFTVALPTSTPADVEAPTAVGPEHGRS